MRLTCSVKGTGGHAKSQVWPQGGKTGNVQLRAVVGIHGALHQKNAGQVLVAKLNGISTKVCVLVYFLRESYKKMEVEGKWRHSQERWKEWQWLLWWAFSLHVLSRSCVHREPALTVPNEHQHAHPTSVTVRPSLPDCISQVLLLSPHSMSAYRFALCVLYSFSFALWTCVFVLLKIMGPPALSTSVSSGPGMQRVWWLV